jgi:RimJ/RimL family protein N-acetyltransferase
MRAAAELSGDDVIEVVLAAQAALDAGGAAVRAAALHAGLGADRATRLRATVEELLREAVDRESVDGAAQLRILTGVQGDRLVVEVHDRRLPLAPGGARALPSRRLAALGFVDRLHIASHGAEGNVSRVEVLLVDPDADLLGGEVLADDVERFGDAEAAAVQIRELHDSDAAGVAQCVYRCYGYTYVDPSMYRPATLRAWRRSGHLHSVVAVTPDGEVVGHCALTFDRPEVAVPEAGKLVVDPRMRGHHLAERLAELRLAVARRLGVPGIWAECVTNHPYSQKEFAALGGVETGLLLGATPAAITMQGLANDAAGRHSLLAMWTRVAAEGAATLHLPERHAALVDAMAQRAGLERTLRTEEPAPSTAHTRLTATADASVGVGALRVTTVGADVVERVAHELDALAAYDLAVVTVDVPLEDPGAAWAITALESLGCCFGAWMPELWRRDAGGGGGVAAGGGAGAGGDVLRLQRVADRPLAADIRCASPEGEAVRDAVLAEWHRVTR